MDLLSNPDALRKLQHQDMHTTAMASGVIQRAPANGFGVGLTVNGNSAPKGSI